MQGIAADTLFKQGKAKRSANDAVHPLFTTAKLRGYRRKDFKS